jgi:hypothetical protein
MVPIVPVTHPLVVIPAKAGISSRMVTAGLHETFAGVTENGAGMALRT